MCMSYIVAAIGGLALAMFLEWTCDHLRLTYESRTTVLALVCQTIAQIFFCLFFKGSPVLELAISLSGGVIIFFFVTYLRKRK